MLTRYETERLLIGPDIRLTVIYAGNGKAKLGIESPSHVAVWREEIAPEGFDTIWGRLPVGKDK